MLKLLSKLDPFAVPNKSNSSNKYIGSINTADSFPSLDHTYIYLVKLIKCFFELSTEQLVEATGHPDQGSALSKLPVQLLNRGGTYGAHVQPPSIWNKKYEIQFKPAIIFNSQIQTRQNQAEPSQAEGRWLSEKWVKYHI